MGEITIYFVGICTFMQDTETTLPGFRRRVVLVNGRVPAVINGAAIPPHIPTLRIAAGDLAVNGVAATSEDGCVLQWELDGCRLEIADTVGELSHDESFECCIPHLKKLTPSLPGPSPEVVVAADPEKASCYFELTAGALSAGLIADGAAVSALRVQTSGEAPVLRVRSFRTDVPQEFQLRSGAEIAIMNVGVEGMAGDDQSDFLLHYEVATSIPADAAIPLGSAPCCKPLPPAAIIPGNLGVGPGCSNSSFP